MPSWSLQSRVGDRHQSNNHKNKCETVTDNIERGVIVIVSNCNWQHWRVGVWVQCLQRLHVKEAWPTWPMRGTEMRPEDRKRSNWGRGAEFARFCKSLKDPVFTQKNDRFQQESVLIRFAFWKFHFGFFGKAGTGERAGEWFADCFWQVTMVANLVC